MIELRYDQHSPTPVAPQFRHNSFFFLCDKQMVIVCQFYLKSHQKVSEKVGHSGRTGMPSNILADKRQKSPFLFDPNFPLNCGSQPWKFCHLPLLVLKIVPWSPPSHQRAPTSQVCAGVPFRGSLRSCFKCSLYNSVVQCTSVRNTGGGKKQMKQLQLALLEGLFPTVCNLHRLKAYKILCQQFIAHNDLLILFIFVFCPLVPSENFIFLS